MSEHKGLPVAGYQPQSDEKVALVNDHKKTEELLLRRLDHFGHRNDIDIRWLSIARTHFEIAFMALNRAVFQPQRIDLPEDSQ